MDEAAVSVFLPAATLRPETVIVTLTALVIVTIVPT